MKTGTFYASLSGSTDIPMAPKASVTQSHGHAMEILGSSLSHSATASMIELTMGSSRASPIPQRHRLSVITAAASLNSSGNYSASSLKA
jgi:hypothetical protein